MSNDDSQKRKIAARIGTAMRDAQYALTVASPQRIPNAMTESYMALVALSEYLSPPNGVPKAAAMAKGIAKIWKKIISLQRHGGSGTMSTTQSEIDPADEHNNRERSFHSLFDETRENHEQQLLREKLTSVQEERDDIVNRLHTATEEMAALKASLHAQNKASSLSTSELEDLQRENTALRTALQEESIRANALVESLRESDELVQKMQQENASMWAMQERQRIQLEDKDKAMEAAVIAASRPNAAPQQAIDKDDYEALKLQVKLLRDALRECSNNPDAANIKAGKKTLVDIENEHQEQLLALKITLETQYTREFEHKQQIDHLSKVIVDIQNQLQREQRRAEEAERNANDSAGSVEQHYRGQLAALQAALDQQQSEHATEVNALRLELESEQRRAEEAERNANDSAGSVEQHYRGQLAALQAALDQQRSEHATEVNALRLELESEQRRAEEAERNANDSAGSVEQHYRGQLAALQAALDQQRSEHATEVNALRLELESEQRRAEEAERNANDSAGSVEQHYRGQLAALQAALDQQRSEHATEVNALRLELESEQRRAEEAERNANDSAGSVEQHYRGQLAALQAALDQQRSEHATEVNALRLELESEQRRAEEAERNANDSAGSVEQHYRGQLAALQAALDQQRSEHATEVNALRLELESEQRRAEEAERNANDSAGSVEQHYRGQLAALQAALDQQQSEHATEVNALRLELESEQRRAEEAERNANDSAGSVEQHYRGQLAALQAALDQQRSEHATEVNALRLELESEQRRAEEAERNANDSAGSVEQHYRGQLAALQAALDQQRSEHATEVNALRLELESEQRRAEEAERNANDSAGSVEQHYRGQLAALQAALDQQRSEHATEVNALRLELESEQRRAEEAERNANDSAGSVEQHYRGQLAALQAALDQQRSEHATEVNALRLELESEQRRAEEAERNANDSAGSVEQHYRGQLAALQAALDQQRSEHATEVNALRLELESEQRRAEEAERNANDSAGSVEQHYRGQLAALQAALDQQRSEHATEVNALRLELESEQRRAEEAERNANDSAGSVEQHYRGQLAALQAALDQQRSEHATEVNALRLELESEQRRAEEAERNANDSAGSVEQHYRGQLAALQAALDQQRSEHATEVNALRLELESEQRRAEEAERNANDSAGSVEQHYRGQLAALQAALDQQRSEHATEVNALRLELESEQRRAEEAERNANDSAGSVEQHYRGQLAALQAALDQQRSEHATEVNALRLELESEQRRAEEAERNANDSAGSVEQHYRGQLAALQAALDQQRSEHATEVNALRLELESEQRRAEEAERNANDSAGSVEQHYRGQLAALQAALDQQRSEHATEVNALRLELESEQRRAEEAERNANDSAGSVEQHYRGQLAALQAALDQQRSEHATEVNALRLELESEQRRAEEAERNANDSAGSVEQHYRGQLAALQAALDQQQSEHATEVNALRLELESEQRRAEEAERNANDSAGSVEQHYRGQLAALQAALDQQQSEHATEVNALRLELESEQRRAEEAERNANDSAGSVEQHYRGQLAALQAALDQQQSEHATEVNALRLELESEQRRAEEAERNANDSAGSVEQHYRGQLAALQAALDQQRSEHATEVNALRLELESEQRRAEEAERNANDSAGSVEQHYRGQLAALQAALDQQRSEHATEVNALRLELESEQRRAEEAERNANDSAGSVEQHYRGQLAALQAALDQQRKEYRRESALLRSNCKLAEEKLVLAESKLNSISAQHREDVNGVNDGFAKERSLLERKLAKAVATRDGAKQEVEVLKNAVRGLEEANQALRLSQEEQCGAFAESEAIFQEEKRSLLGDISLLRSRCLSLEQEVACCNELVQEKTATVNKLVNQLTVARPAMTDSSRSCEGKPALVSVGVEESVHFLRDIVETELKRVIRSTVVVDEESERVMNVARDLRSAIDCTGGLAVRVMERQRKLTHLLNIVMAKQNVALRKIQLCILGSVSLRKSDVAVLEACLLLFNDVECALSEVQETETKEPFKTELPVRVEDERDVLLQRALRRAQNRVNESMSSSPAAHDNTPRGSGLMMTPVKSVGASTALKPPSEKKSFTSPSQGKRMTPAGESSPYSCASAPDRHTKDDFSFVRSDPFDYAVATLSAQERKHDRRQQQQQHQSMPLKRWVTPGKGGASARTGL